MTPTLTPTPPLFVGSIAPSSGPSAGGTAVTVSGAGFLPGASLTIGGVMAKSVVVQGSSEIDASAPALPAGTLNDVSVTNPASLVRRAQDSAVLVRGYLADFLDVHQANSFQASVESVFRNGITAAAAAATTAAPRV